LCYHVFGEELDFVGIFPFVSAFWQLQEAFMIPIFSKKQQLPAI
jgi:hypothetical protein